jgi:hypothetical protein
VPEEVEFVRIAILDSSFEVSPGSNGLRMELFMFTVSHGFRGACVCKNALILLVVCARLIAWVICVVIVLEVRRISGGRW